jgi:hypothetical protein
LYEPIKFTAAMRLRLVATRNSHAALQSEINHPSNTSANSPRA